jgi:hypothetical protein
VAEPHRSRYELAVGQDVPFDVGGCDNGIDEFEFEPAGIGLEFLHEGVHVEAKVLLRLAGDHRDPFCPSA